MYTEYDTFFEQDNFIAAVTWHASSNALISWNLNYYNHAFNCIVMAIVSIYGSFGNEFRGFLFGGRTLADDSPAGTFEAEGDVKWSLCDVQVWKTDLKLYFV